MLIVTSQDSLVTAVIGAGSAIEIKRLGGANGEYYGIYANCEFLGEFGKMEKAQKVMAQIQEDLVLAALWLSKNQSKMLKKEPVKEYAKAYLSYKIPTDGGIL